MAAADVARLSPSRERDLAIVTTAFDWVIRTHVASDGSFGPPVGTEPNNEISDAEILVYLGTAYVEVHQWLSRQTRAAWLMAIRRAALWLGPDLNYYVNGNINIALTLGMYVAYRATHDATFLADYERSLAFTLHPPQSRWRGYGLRVVTRPQKSDSADGSGYLAERGRGGTGFDAHYTTVQVGYVATLYLLSQDPRVLRLLNLETNMLLARTNPRTDVFNGSSGSRHTGQFYGYLESPGPLVLLLLDHRGDLRRVVNAGLHEISLSFHEYAVQADDQDVPIAFFANALLAASVGG